MKKISAAPFILLFVLFFTIQAYASTPDITGPEVSVVDNNIIVNLSLNNISELDEPIRSGIGKVIVFTVELLREWKFWPDEFIVSKKIEKTIKYDNLRNQYLTVSADGVSRKEKHFDDFYKMKDWIFSVETLNLANIKELEPGIYYIRVVVESKSFEQLPLLGMLMHFIPEVEMTLAKESGTFVVGDLQ